MESTLREEIESEADLEKEIRARFGEGVLEGLIEKKINEALGKVQAVSQYPNTLCTSNAAAVTLNPNTVSMTNIEAVTINPKEAAEHDRRIDSEKEGDNKVNHGAIIVGTDQVNGQTRTLIEQRETIGVQQNCYGGNHHREEHGLASWWGGMRYGRRLTLGEKQWGRRNSITYNLQCKRANRWCT